MLLVVVGYRLMLDGSTLVALRVVYHPWYTQSSYLSLSLSVTVSVSVSLSHTHAFVLRLHKATDVRQHATQHVWTIQHQVVTNCHQ